MSTLINKFQAMPRAMQWAAVAMLGMALFLLWDSFLKPVAEEWDKAAAKIEANVTVARQGRKVAQDLERPELKPVVLALGPIRPPASQLESTVDHTINSVLDKHGASNQSISKRAPARLPRSSNSTLAQNRRIDKISMELKFEATPAAAMAIISDLEASPEVHSVYSVRMTRDAGGRVKAQLTIEAWVFASEIGARGGSA